MVVGKYDWTLGAEYGQVVDLAWYDVHPQRYGYNYDSAILQLAKSVVFSSSVLPACLPSPGANYDKVAVVASGWGDGSPNFKKLYKVSLTTMPNYKCRELWSEISSLTKNMICTNAPGRNVCTGDSGGPLVTQERAGYYTLVGVTSWGSKPCVHPGNSGVFARVSAQLRWIKDNIEGITCPKP